MTSKRSIIRVGKIEERILLIRGDKVIIDADLADFYGVPTKRLNEQMKRNRGRFPEDFVFQLTSEEKSEVVAKCDHLANLKYSSTLPHAFTEHGALMAAGILNTPHAVEVSVFVVRALVKLRRVVAQHKELTHKLTEIEQNLLRHDRQIVALVQAIRQLMNPNPVPERRRIGFGDLEP